LADFTPSCGTLADPAQLLALPGHKRLKLTEHALALTGAEGQEQVGDEIRKFYAQPPAGSCHEPLPLASLTFLETGEDLAMTPIRGAERIARLSDDHYTATYHQLATQLAPAERFMLQTRLATGLTMHRLVRPWDSSAFSASAALAYRWIVNQ
jgi:hypothetical protein